MADEHDDDDPLGGDATPKHVCPECGEEFKLAMHLGSHRKSKHGVEPANPRKRRGRGGASTGEPQSSPKLRRKQAISATLRELADLADDARGRTTELPPQHLADVIRRDADKIATVLSTVAEKVDPVAWFVDATMGPAGVLTLLVGLSGVGRWLLRFWHNRPRDEQVVELTPEEFAALEAEARERDFGGVAT